MNAAVRTQLRFLLCDTIGESDLIYTTLTLTSAWNKINDHMLSRQPDGCRLNITSAGGWPAVGSLRAARKHLKS